ncbi:MAG: hypothetical protein Q3966_06450 [Neisseria sp.]|nr:hypothetical protein [Neisseria sp.]
MATYTLLLYQNTLLEKRCNDAGRGNYIAYCLSRANMALAVLNLLLPILPSLLIFGGLLQFALGLALPANPLPNLMGCPKPDTAAQKAAAALSCAAASLMPIVLIIQMRA